MCPMLSFPEMKPRHPGRVENFFHGENTVIR
nr:MAG TPA: hypothetical protein [Bacteriophage sp.]